MPLGPKVAVQEDPNIGKGIFAIEKIEPGEVVWWWDHEPEPLRTYSRAELHSIPGETGDWLRMYSYFVDEDLFGSQPQNEPMDISYYFNHTCEPNCWYDGDEKLVAMRTIMPGEHVAYDYAMTETELSSHVGLKCLCGAKNCRGELTFREYRNPEWLAKYEAHSTSFIQRKAHEQGYVNRSIYLKHNINDKARPEKGLYTLAPIKKGEVCIVFSGVLTKTSQLNELPVTHKHLWMQVNDDLWQVARLHNGEDVEKGDQVNHSCDPNLEFEDSVTLVAKRDLEVGEEVTFDYALVMSAPEYESDFECSCGAANCRRLIKWDDWKLPEVQEAHFPNVPPFMRRMMLKHNPALASKQ